MSKASLRKSVRDKVVEAEPISELETDILEALTLREALTKVAELEKRYKKLRAKLLQRFREPGRNGPLTAPGVQVSFTSVDIPEYTVSARTDWRIAFTKVVSVPNAD
jgi:hypothetical protein